MGATFRYLALPEEEKCVLDWFRQRSVPPVEKAQSGCSIFYFPDAGPLAVDNYKSPLVSVYAPVRKRGVLTTIGEVHFLAKPISSFPKLRAIQSQFRKWLSSHPCVYSRKPEFQADWNYWLEGSVQNLDSEIFALPLGLEALQAGSYFVAEGDNETVLERVCRQLRLRGVEGISNPAI
jgi:hypothetical protein